MLLYSGTHVVISFPLSPNPRLSGPGPAALQWATWHLASCSMLLWSPSVLWGQENLLILSANLELIRQASLSLQGAKVASSVEGPQLVSCSFNNLWHSHTILVISDILHSWMSVSLEDCLPITASLSLSSQMRWTETAVVLCYAAFSLKDVMDICISGSKQLIRGSRATITAQYFVCSGPHQRLLFIPQLMLC